MSKIILDEAPSTGSWERCPFALDSDYRKCMLSKMECNCIGGYRDYISFDFTRCPYCITIEQIQQKKETEKAEIHF